MIHTLIKSVRNYKKQSIIAPLFVAMEVVLECILPLIIAKVIDNIKVGDIKVLIIDSILLLVMSFGALFCGTMSGKFSAIAASGFASNLRKDLFYKVQDFSFANIDKFSSSSLVTRMTTDVNNVQMAYGMIIRTAIRVPLMMVFSVVMAFTLNIKLSLIFVALIPVVGTALFIIIKLSMPRFNKAFTKYDNLNASVQENINGIRVVKTFVREDYENEKFTKASDEIASNFGGAEKIIAWNGPVMQLAMYAASILVSIFGAIIIINTFGGYDAENNPIWGELSTGSLTSLITYGIQILMSLMMLSMVFVMLTLSIASGRRIAEVLDEESSLHNPENPVYEVKDGRIDFNNVSFKYKVDAEKYALENINLHIKTGETVGIIGTTGSSKTTLVNLISRLYDASIGEVEVGGINVKEYDLETLRNQVAVVLQKNVLFSGTINENLRWGDKEATDEEIARVCKLAQCSDFIESFPDKYETKIDQGGTNVSGGQKQRLCIARALLKKPKILILDDSTSAVDTKTDALIRKALREEIPGTTKIIIAQRVASVIDADKIIVMENGKISGMGSHEELLKNNEVYQEVYNIQNKIGGSK